MTDRLRRVTRRAGLHQARERVRRHHPDYNKLETQGWKSLDAEAKLSSAGYSKEMQWALDMGLPGADSLEDRSIPTFSRGEKPHFAGINTFLKAPFVENIRDVGKYDAAIVGGTKAPPRGSRSRWTADPEERKGAMSVETRALVLSAAAAMVIGVAAAVVALLTGSGAILLDAAFNLCFFGTALVTLRVANLLQRPDDVHYPFGYLHFEPLINLVKGLLIIGVGLLALIDAGIAIGRGGNPLSAGLALGYAVFACVLCAAVLVTLRRGQRQAASPLVQGDVENWTVNLAISIGMFVAFCLAIFFQRRGMEVAAKLVDPILVSLVVLLTVPVPIRMAGQALMALLKRAPDAGIVSSIEALVKGAMSALPVRELYVRVVQPGRTTYAMVHVLLDEAEAGLDVARADTLRRAAVAAVAARHAPVILDIVFTTVQEFAAPTTGFVTDLPARSD